MIVIFENHTDEQNIQRVTGKLHDWGFTVHRFESEGQPVLAMSGVNPDFDLREIQMLPGVRRAFHVTEPYKLANRELHPEGTNIRIGNVTFGGSDVVMIAGPCSAETEEQVHTIADLVAGQGVKVLRGGAFKPRTSPYSFQGLGEEGLRFLREAADRHSMLVVSEVMDVRQIETVERYVDILQIGSRNMQNYSLIKELSNSQKPILLKRGMAATIEEWLMSAEYLISGGNPNVILCERGIRTFESSTRNTLDLNAIPVIHQKSHLPIIVDPSHAVGMRDKVPPMARAAIAAGADGVMVEVHHNPAVAKSDGPQSLLPGQFISLMAELHAIASALNRRLI